ncbi:hypothetical protein ACFP2F_19285 [Hymenobacter artigasi]|uniref:Uncharacterized protein n=1 Tax=Hymenobacter artigasi TaxID=2719616 RepID=A0ABX1HN04_9BACT|nr:hypothetical protein [Hymenobacter artigasi]NKI90482.1 hypothetical protein [Hymenobacter artigasi]
MKKILLPALGLAFLLGTTTEACAQANLVHGIVAGINLARMAANKKNAPTAASTTAMATYRGQAFPMQRTPADQLPKKGAEQVTEVETQLDRFHTALLADSTSALCTPEQRTAIQTALVGLARAQSRWDLQPYQQEATFYLAEDARRQKAAPTK